MKHHNGTFITFAVIFNFAIGSLTASEGALRGRFAISKTDTIAFSRGNLQYSKGTGIWRFAENQWNFIGGGTYDNKGGNVYDNGVRQDNSYLNTSYSGWIDLFGWGTGNNPTLYTTTNSRYGTFNEWGNRAISNGGNKSGVWRTLSIAEWDYLYHGRENAAALYANGNVNGVNGNILLPDNWLLPEGLHFKPSNDTDDNAEPNTYTADEWVIMEMAGAVFLPITYERMRDWQQQDYCTAVYVQQTARYWSSSAWNTNGAYYYIVFGNPGIYQDNRYVGKAVRLVQNHDGSDLFPIMPNANSALFRWISVPNADTYTLYIYEDETRTTEKLRINFDSNGIVIGLHFARHKQVRTQSDDNGEYAQRQFFYTISDLDANTDYWYTLISENTDREVISSTIGRFKTTVQTDYTPTKITTEEIAPTRARKYLSNGRIIIIDNGQAYTLEGQKVLPAY